MKICSSRCPMFDMCPLMPISAKPAKMSDRKCLVNTGSNDVRRAFINLFLRGHSGLVDEMMRAYTSYLQSVEDFDNDMKDAGGKVKDMPARDRERLVNHRRKILDATLAIHRTFYGDG